MNLKDYNIKYGHSVTEWDKALPLGCGKIGCLVYGDGPLRLSLDRGELWDRRVNLTTLESGFNYKNLVRLIKSGTDEDMKEYYRLFDNVFGNTLYPTKITAGRIEIDYGAQNDDLTYNLDIKKALAQVKSKKNDFSAEIFTSAERFIGVAEINGIFSVDFHLPEYISDKENGLGYPEAEIKRIGGFTYYLQRTFTDFCYGIVVLKRQFENRSELYFTIGCGEDDSFIKETMEELEDASEYGYDTLKKEHIKWWEKYYDKSSISIKDKTLETTYYRSTYLFASCSRKGFFPMPLQGVWTADDGCIPPWKGDYHYDTNTELSYQAYLKANRLDEGEVFVDYMWNLRGQFRKFAKEFFGVDGILIPSCSTIDGKPMGGWAQYSLSPTMTIWAAQSFDEYWLYTGDRDFLKDKAYPFFKETGDAIVALLEEKDGKLYLPLSSSPEIFDNLRKAYLEPNSNFDLALLTYLFKTLKGYTEELGIDGSEYDNILSKLDPIATMKGINNDLEEIEFISLDKTQKLAESHRHFSHIMCMYPLHLINYDTEENKALYEGTRYELERYGTGMWVGFSFGMMAQFYAMMGIGNSAREMLKTFAKGFVEENGFHLNGDFKNYGFCTWHYRPFTLESLYSFCDALHEMLMQDHMGYISLFPAVPDKWKKEKISFKKLRSRGGVLVSAERNGSKLMKIEIISPKKCKILLKADDEFLGAEIHAGLITRTEVRDGIITIYAKRGRNVITLKK